MARRRRPGARTSVVDEVVTILLPLESLVDADGQALDRERIGTWFARVDSFPSTKLRHDERLALVFDRFVWDLHLGDVAHATDTHSGDDFFDAATSLGDVAVYVCDDLDPRRAKPDDFSDAAAAGKLRGAIARGFAVDTVQP